MSFLCKQKTAYELRISDWSSDVCSSDLRGPAATASIFARPPGPDVPCSWLISRSQPDTRRGEAVRHVVANVVDIALHVLGDGVDEVVEHRQDHAALVAHHDRHLAVHGRTLGLVELGAGRQQQLVEVGTEEARVVRSEEHTSELQSLMRT